MFALFAGATYYPSGGWNDLVGTYDTEELAVAAGAVAAADGYNWWHVIDLSTAEEVASN